MTFGSKIKWTPYRAELAEELRAQGYEIAADVKGSMRLKEMPRDIERHFSKRRVQIETAMAERGTTSELDAVSAEAWAAIADPKALCPF